jgi:hypothetical protein
MSWSSVPVLRPLGVGERLDAGFKIFGRNFLPMAKAVLVVAVPAGIVEVLISISTALPSQTTTSGPFGTATTTVPTSDRWAYSAGLLLLFVVAEVVAAIATATCYRIIVGAYLGQPMPWREALRFGVRRLPSILWIFFLVFVVLVVPALPVVLLVVLFAVIHATAAVILLAVFGGLTWIVFLVWFSACSRLAVPTLMLEDTRGANAIRRSVDLTRGHWWSVFGTEVLASLIVSVFSAAVGVVLAFVVVASHDSTAANAISSFFVRTLSLVVATPFTAAILVVISIDLRVRKEGFDIQLLASQMGAPATGSALSFLRRPSGYPPQQAWPTPGWSGPPGYPPQSPGYPPQSPGWGPPPSPEFPPRPSYPPPPASPPPPPPRPIPPPPPMIPVPPRPATPMEPPPPTAPTEPPHPPSSATPPPPPMRPVPPPPPPPPSVPGRDDETSA